MPLCPAYLHRSDGCTRCSAAGVPDKRTSRFPGAASLPPVFYRKPDNPFRPERHRKPQVACHLRFLLLSLHWNLCLHCASSPASYIRLVDLEQQTHEQCAAQMDISRSTVQEIYESARSKIGVLSTGNRCTSPGKLPHLRRTGGSSLRPLLPDAESQHGKIRQNLQRRFHYENCSCL